MTLLLADAKSHFSQGESILQPKDIAREAAAAGWKAAALCDTMTISGMPDFTKACEEFDIKPIIGVRLRIVEELNKDRKQKAVFPKLFILSEEGFQIVTRLLSLANDADHFYYIPRLTWSDAFYALKDAEGHIAASTGTLYSALKHSEALDIASKLSACLSASQTFCEVVPSDSAVWDKQAKLAYEIADTLGLPVLLSKPLIYADEKSGSHLQVMSAIMMNMKGMRTTFDAWVKDYDAKPPAKVAKDAKDQIKRLNLRGVGVDESDLKSNISNWKSLAEAVKFKWHKLDVSLPEMAPDENAALRELARDGLKKRLASNVFGHQPSRSDWSEYAERLKYELGVLTSMGFAGYFLLTHDIVNWSKTNGIRVGPGRGSVGGSLVAYAIGITDVDPIRFGLIFERFINPDRLDLPDADLDFMSTRRHEVIEYIENKYGKDYVAGISNYSMLGAKGVLSDITRISGLSMEDQILSKEIGDDQSLEEAMKEVKSIEKFATREPDLWSTACALEGRLRTLSRHAAGVVVAGEPLVNRSVVETRKGERTVNWDKRVVEDMGLVKLDILGLKTLDLIEVALKKIERRTGARISLEEIPLDDQEVLKAFGEGRTVGVFQFESAGMRKLLKNIYRLSGGITFEDISAATALYRPGPMESGLMDDFVEIKAGMSEPVYEHETMRASLEETESVIIYQEQVMRVAQDLCGFSMAEADHLRKAIGKKNKEAMAKQGDAFVSGAVKSGMDEGAAQELWDKIVLFAGYSFNKSHSVEYSLISYQSMYLKVYHPLEFFAAALTILDSDKTPGLIADAKKSGIQVQPPEINTSTAEFEILDDTALVAPFSVIKGLSARGTDVIVEERTKSGPFISMQSFRDRTPARNVNKAVFERLDLVGSFSKIEPQPPALDPSRRSDQLEIMPAIMTGGVLVSRTVPSDRMTKSDIKEMLVEFRDTASCLENAVMVTPRAGKHARFMVVFDGPTSGDEKERQFTRGSSFEVVQEALDETDLEVSDAYWTGLCKSPKRKNEKLFSPAQVSEFGELFKKELTALKPQVILVLGSQAARFFDPSFRGALADAAGSVKYHKDLLGLGFDANIVLGLNPGMVHFDHHKQEPLNEAFGIVREMIDGL